jgi:hypothetical protein
MTKTLAGTAGILASVLLLTACEVQDQRRDTTRDVTPPPRDIEPAPAPPRDRELQPTPAPPREPAPTPGAPATPGADNQDQQIKLKIQQHIQQDQMLAPQATYITITVNNGVVTLSGNVQSHEHMTIILDHAWQVEGVIEVVNELQVTEQQQPGDQQPL